MLSEPKLDNMAETHEFIDIKATTSLENGVLANNAEFLRISKSLVRKLDFTLMPMIWILYMFNYLDRNNIRWELILHNVIARANSRQSSKVEYFREGYRLGW